jgi:hypothetical protein
VWLRIGSTGTVGAGIAIWTPAIKGGVSTHKAAYAHATDDFRAVMAPFLLSSRTGSPGYIPSDGLLRKPQRAAPGDGHASGSRRLGDPAFTPPRATPSCDRRGPEHWTTDARPDRTSTVSTNDRRAVFGFDPRRAS